MMGGYSSQMRAKTASIISFGAPGDGDISTKVWKTFR